MASVASSEVRCVSTGCKYPGLNTKNKNAVGVCGKCGCFEHYECSKQNLKTKKTSLKDYNRIYVLCVLRKILL